jgi:subtilisin family serine protease
MAGGATFGVAKKATLVNVQVMGSASGSTTTIVDGMTWTVNDIVSKNRVGKSVINMSLSTPTTSKVLNDAVQAAIDNGIPVVAAAGNSNEDSVNTSPANQPNAIAVAACNKNYQRWAYSNWGSTVDIFAPGQEVTVASATGTNASRISSGTSEAAPVVAGVVAYLLALEGPRTPAEIKTRLEELAIKDKITDTKEVPNLLLYNGIGK